ncbi:MAG: hypothetical protein ABIH89_09085 [Elusimicrobiota bacterium]
MTRILYSAVFLIILGLNAFLSASGIITPFTECSLHDIEPGRTYSFTEEKDMPLKIKNTGKSRLTVKVDIKSPAENELKEDYEVLPDKTWITVENSILNIESGEWGITDIFLKIPKDKQYAGRSYQASLFSQTLGKDGKIKAALKSRIYFSVKRKKGFFGKIFGWL